VTSEKPQPDKIREMGWQQQQGRGFCSAWRGGQWRLLCRFRWGAGFEWLIVAEKANRFWLPAVPPWPWLCRAALCS